MKETELKGVQKKRTSDEKERKPPNQKNTNDPQPEPPEKGNSARIPPQKRGGTLKKR